MLMSADLVDGYRFFLLSDDAFEAHPDDISARKRGGKTARMTQRTTNSIFDFVFFSNKDCGDKVRNKETNRKRIKQETQAASSGHSCAT